MFNEKETEFSKKQGKEIQVFQSPKYAEAKKKALELIESKQYGVEESDFWILMNETKSGKMMYTGLIISHNGCLKINDKLEDKLKFKPSCITIDKEGFGGSLVYTYINDEQGIYEVGEVSKENCQNSYPYAMALKRCMDRVILKNCKLAYAGVYSDVEADEFQQPTPTEKTQTITDEQYNILVGLFGQYADKTKKCTVEELIERTLTLYRVSKLENLPTTAYVEVLQKLKKDLGGN